LELWWEHYARTRVSALDHQTLFVCLNDDTVELFFAGEFTLRSPSNSD
jgi:hypothetical protein